MPTYLDPITGWPHPCDPPLADQAALSWLDGGWFYPAALYAEFQWLQPVVSEPLGKEVPLFSKLQLLSVDSDNFVRFRTPGSNPRCQISFERRLVVATDLYTVDVQITLFSSPPFGSFKVDLMDGGLERWWSSVPVRTSGPNLDSFTGRWKIGGPFFTGRLTVSPADPNAEWDNEEWDFKWAFPLP